MQGFRDGPAYARGKDARAPFPSAVHASTRASLLSLPPSRTHTHSPAKQQGHARQRRLGRHGLTARHRRGARQTEARATHKRLLVLCLTPVPLKVHAYRAPLCALGQGQVRRLAGGEGRARVGSRLVARSGGCGAITTQHLPDNTTPPALAAPRPPGSAVCWCHRPLPPPPSAPPPPPPRTAARVAGTLPGATGAPRAARATLRQRRAPRPGRAPARPGRQAGVCVAAVQSRYRVWGSGGVGARLLHGA